MTPPNTILNDYEVSSEGAVRHWEIPIIGRLDKVGNSAASATNSVPGKACAVISLTYGVQLTGTILTQDTSGTDRVVVDFTCSMVYKHYVRNVLTYDSGEATWGAINIGDAVYYDRENTNARLSTAPNDNTGNANPLFGFVVPWSDTDADAYAAGTKGAATADTYTCAVMQVGAGAEGSDGV